MCEILARRASYLRDIEIRTFLFEEDDRYTWMYDIYSSSNEDGGVDRMLLVQRSIKLAWHSAVKLRFVGVVWCGEIWRVAYVSCWLLITPVLWLRSDVRNLMPKDLEVCSRSTFITCLGTTKSCTLMKLHRWVCKRMAEAAS